jgi:hypothetical protein
MSMSARARPLFSLRAFHGRARYPARQVDIAAFDADGGDGNTVYEVARPRPYQMIPGITAYSAHQLNVLGAERRFPFEETYGQLPVELEFVTVDNATIFGDTACVLDESGDIVLESLWPQFRRNPFAAVADMKGFEACTDGGDIDATVILLGCGSRSRNYWHWHIEMLPVAMLLRNSAALQNCRIAVLKLAPWQLRSLQLLGFAPSQIIELDNKAIKFRRVVLCSLMYDPAGAPDPLALEAFAAIAQSVLSLAAPADRPPSPLIYVSRRDSAQRQLLQEDELAARLEAAGFSIVRTSELSYDEQIVRFASAAIVVAPHGAGLTNLGFARPGTCVVEVFPFGLFNSPHYYLLSGAMGHRYEPYFSTVRSRIDVDVAWSIDVDDFLFRLSVNPDFVRLAPDAVRALWDPATARALPATASDGRAPDITRTDQIPTSLAFSEANDHRHIYSLFGFSGSEAWGTWMDGRDGAIIFKAPLPERFTFVMEYAPYEPGLAKPLVFRIGTTVRHMALSGHGQLRIPVENPGRDCAIWINAPGAISPAEEPDSDVATADERVLSIGVICIYVLPPAPADELDEV